MKYSKLLVCKIICQTVQGAHLQHVIRLHASIYMRQYLHVLGGAAVFVSSGVQIVQFAVASMAKQQLSVQVTERLKGARWDSLDSVSQYLFHGKPSCTMMTKQCDVPSGEGHRGLQI